MNHDEAVRYLDDLGADLRVGRPSTADLIAQGRAAQRRRTRRVTALSAASVALVLGGTAVVQQAIAGGDGGTSHSRVAAPPSAPDGMRLVGRGGAVAAVPESWTQDQNDCTTSGTGNVYFPPVPPRSCHAPNLSSPESMQPTLGISELTLSADALDKFEPLEGSAGAVAEAGLCLESRPTSCSQRIAVPSEGVLFTLTWWRAGDSEATVAQVRESLQLLPEGYAAVPFVEPGTMRSVAEGMVESAGLKPAVSAADVDVPVIGTEPAAGSVVRAPSEVTLLLEPVGPPIEGTWTALLSGITGGQDLESTYRDTTFTLSFENGEMRGDDECNYFGSDYEQSGEDLRLGPIETTLVGCDSTSAIIRALDDVRHVTKVGDELHLHAHHWGIVLTLKPPAEHGIPTELTCPTELRAVGNVPFFDETAPGSSTPEGAVEAWLNGPLSGSLGPGYVMDEDKSHAWILRPDGTAVARVKVELTVGGGYFYYGHEACG
jgi:heat shock protein HslJ